MTATATASTLFDKVWDPHVVRDLGDGWALVHVDRHLLHDLSGPPSFAELRRRDLVVHDPALTFATPDHLVSSAPGAPGALGGIGEATELGAAMGDLLREGAAEAGIRLFDLGRPGQGIVHVMGPELGLVLPGTTVVCGDSHTCTNGALGALAFGIGSSQVTQVLATQTLTLHRPRQWRIRIDGELAEGVTAKDLALALIARFGAAAGAGSAVEYAGPAVERMDVEGRLTLCNLTVELGARYGMIAPDDTTLAWLAGRPFAPEHPVAAWRDLASDPHAAFDREDAVDAAVVGPMVTWGTSPEHAVRIDGAVPDPDQAADGREAEAWRAAAEYMGVSPGQPIAGTPVDWVFVGSCANARLPDLRAAAAVARGRHVADGVRAWVVPGSELVRRQAEAEGLDAVFDAAGFEWRRPGCSMCVAANGERVPSGARCVSTSNRNFVGRQGPGARTHLASPATAAASAVSGRITDPRTL